MKKGRNGYKNQKRREAKPVPKSNRWKFIRTCSGWFVQSEIAFCGLQTTPFHLEAIKPRKELEKIRKTKVMGNCGTCNFHKLWEIAEHAMNRELRWEVKTELGKSKTVKPSAKSFYNKLQKTRQKQTVLWEKSGFSAVPILRWLHNRFFSCDIVNISWFRHQFSQTSDQKFQKASR